MKRSHALLALITVLSAGLGAAWWMSPGAAEEVRTNIAPASMAERPVSQAAPPVTADIRLAAGQIMGIGIGSDLEQARATWDPLRDGNDRARQGGEEEGERVYWKLKGTEYSWIMAWAEEDGKITRLRAMLRPDKFKPFGEVGDLTTAAVNQPDRAVWNLTSADGVPFRVVAQGPEQRATTIYIVSLRAE